MHAHHASFRFASLVLVAALTSTVAGQTGEVVPAESLRPLPDKLVVLTFDDSVKSHFTFVRPTLKQYGFGATFFITEGFDFATDKENYMTWQQIARLHRDGFEIGNHTRDHVGITDDKAAQLAEQLEGINRRCREHNIPRPTSFAWPGNAISKKAFATLRKHGIQFARRGGSPEFPYKEGRGFAYQPGLDHPLLIPSAGDARPVWDLDDFRRAVEQARFGRVAVLQFHGVPDGDHPWVSLSREKFQTMMNFLAREKYQVVALRDLARYVDPKVAPRDPDGVIEDRRSALTKKFARDNFRRPQSPAEARYWVANMQRHGFSPVEMSAATGMNVSELTPLVESLARQPVFPKGNRPWLLPHPGGRHPRIGFRDGAIRPQRETKVSVFLPWKDAGYVVADVPEAIWVGQGGGRQLLYLAHTHVPTMWSKQGVDLPPLEWQRHDDGRLSIERTLPNKVAFGATVTPADRAVKMELWIRNGTNQMLTGLRVQNCVMLRDALGFNQLTNDNKRWEADNPLVACHDASGKRWIITGWVPCLRPWANQHCPCLHSDPQFPDCPPAETRRLRGWLSFYEGDDIDTELKRLQKLDWLKP